MSVQIPLSTLNNAAGGYLTARQIANVILPLLANNQVTRKIMRRWPTLIPGAGIDVPKVVLGSTARWTSQGSPKNVDGMEFGSMALTPKKLTDIIPISMELMRDSVVDIGREAMNDLARAIGELQDLAFLGFDANNPFTNGGVYDVLKAASRTVAWGTGADAAIDISNAMGLVEANGYEVTAMVAHPKVKALIRNLRNPVTGAPLYYDSLTDRDPSTLYGIPIYFTRQVPIVMHANGAITGGSATCIVMGQWNMATFGDTDQLSLKKSEEATITIGGNLVSCFENNLVAIRAEQAVAFAVQETAASKCAFSAVIAIS